MSIFQLHNTGFWRDSKGLHKAKPVRLGQVQGFWVRTNEGEAEARTPSEEGLKMACVGSANRFHHRTQKGGHPTFLVLLLVLAVVRVAWDRFFRAHVDMLTPVGSNCVGGPI